MQWLLHRLFSRMQGSSFAVVFWNGERRSYGSGAPAFTLRLASPLPIWRALRSPELAFGEGYMNGEIEVEGDLDALLDLVFLNDSSLPGHGVLRWAARLAVMLPTAAARQRRQVQSHYDLGNEFYRLWLDPTLSYSCAYFRHPSDPLHQAQLQKIDHTLRKLCLRPGERLLDIGCGWGWLVLRAAQTCGVQGVGITLSREQFAAARQRVVDLGLERQVEIRLQDYRELAAQGGVFDKLVSVGMFEHVGRAQIPRFMAALQRLIRPGGLGLLHTITRPQEAAVNAWTARYIFPGGYVPSWRETIWALAEHDLRLLDAEDLRPHYALTLDHWAANYEAALAAVTAMYGPAFVRMWRLYLRGSAAAFRHGGLHVHQFLVSRGVAAQVPLTREFLYEGRRNVDASGGTAASGTLPVPP